MKQAIHFFLLASFIFSCGCKVSQPKNDPLDWEGKRVLFLGNSITHNGTYVSFVSYFLRKLKPQISHDIISIGLGSETVSCLSEADHPYPRPCLEERLNRALDSIHPEIVLICYGMNDGIYHPQSPERLSAYKQGIRSTISQIEKAGAEAIIISPPPFDAIPIQARCVGEPFDNFGYKHPFENYDDVLGDYAAWIADSLSKSYPIIDIHTQLHSFLEEKRKGDPSFTLAPDGVHPNPLGHLLIARPILSKIDIEIGDNLEELLSEITSDTVFQLTHKQRQMRSKGWLEYVGYTRGKTVKSDSIQGIEEQVKVFEREISAFIENTAVLD